MHTSGGGGHSGGQHGHHAGHVGGHSGGSQGGTSIGQILGLNNGHSVIGHFLGGHHGSHHHAGGEPDQSPSWNMAFQDTQHPNLLQRFLNIKIRFNTAFWFFILFGGMTAWLFVEYEIRHHEWKGGSASLRFTSAHQSNSLFGKPANNNNNNGLMAPQATAGATYASEVPRSSASTAAFASSPTFVVPTITNPIPVTGTIAVADPVPVVNTVAVTNKQPVVYGYSQPIETVPQRFRMFVNR